MVSTRFQARQNNEDENRSGSNRGNVRDKNILNVAKTPSNQPKLSSGRRQRRRAPTSYRQLIRPSPGKRIRVEVTTEGHALNNPTFARRLGQLVRLHVPILIRNFMNAHLKVKDLILRDLKRSFDWGNNPNVLVGILNRAGKIYTDWREQLKAIVQSATSVKEAYKLAPPGVAAQEWRATVHWWWAEKLEDQMIGISNLTEYDSQYYSEYDSDSSVSVTQKTPANAFRSVYHEEHCDCDFCDGAGASETDGCRSERGDISQHDLHNMKEELERIRQSDYYYNKQMQEQLNEEIQNNSMLAHLNDQLTAQLRRKNEFMTQFLLILRHMAGGSGDSFPSPPRPDDDPPSAGED